MSRLAIGSFIPIILFSSSCEEKTMLPANAMRMFATIPFCVSTRKTKAAESGLINLEGPTLRNISISHSSNGTLIFVITKLLGTPLNFENGMNFVSFWFLTSICALSARSGAQSVCFIPGEQMFPPSVAMLRTASVPMDSSAS